MATTSEVLVTNLAGGTRLDSSGSPSQSMLVTNFGPNPIYLTFGSTSAGSKKGNVVAAGGSIGPLSVDPAVGVWAIADTAAQITGAATIVSEL